VIACPSETSFEQNNAFPKGRFDINAQDDSYMSHKSVTPGQENGGGGGKRACGSSASPTQVYWASYRAIE
jgi:hypothetical protein